MTFLSKRLVCVLVEVQERVRHMTPEVAVWRRVFVEIDTKYLSGTSQPLQDHCLYMIRKSLLGHEGRLPEPDPNFKRCTAKVPQALV